MNDTPLDQAHSAAEASGEPADRLAFWSRLAEAELSLWLDGDADADGVTPYLFDLEGGTYALAFDRADRLAAFAGAEAATATLSGRMLAGLLSDQGLGLGLNLGDAPSAQLIEADALAWLVDTLSSGPAEEAATIETITPPGDLPDALLRALDGKLGAMAGLARSAYLAGAVYDGGTRAHLMAFVDPVDGAEGALARAVSDALALSGLEAGTLDVTFVAASNPLAGALARHGLRIELPEVAKGVTIEMRDDAPPRLR
ncbi:SseB family protein [Jannaschia sp. LMIT008]|uniref:SseB family protein n=1 Tax=Jannaschia maritima TaxID=3032585 RepID=UPI002811B8F1|nr:SseB family protein [Jannaschia sp. LMIT008]